MGSSLSSKGNVPDPVPTELSGLYPVCKWDARVIRKFILSKKLAPLYPGIEKDEEHVDDSLEECPICFLHYPGGLNRVACCNKGVCTECCLQITNPNSLSNVTCPFCNRSPSYFVFTGPKSPELKQKEALERQKVIELQIKIRNEEMERDKERQKERASSFAEMSRSLPNELTSQPKEQTFTSSSYPRMHPSDLELEQILIDQAIKLSLQQTTEEVKDPNETPTSPEEEEEEEPLDHEEKEEMESESEELALALALSLSVQ